MHVTKDKIVAFDNMTEEANLLLANTSLNTSLLKNGTDFEDKPTVYTSSYA